MTKFKDFGWTTRWYFAASFFSPSRFIAAGVVILSLIFDLGEIWKPRRNAVKTSIAEGTERDLVVKKQAILWLMTFTLENL